MLSFLRKHQYGFMLVVAIIVIVAFTFFYDASDRAGNPRTEKVFTVYGKSYNRADLQRYRSTLELAARLGMYELIFTLQGERLDESPQDFIYNLIIFREEAGKLGVRASQEEIEARILQMRAFSPAGSYDQATFDNVKAQLGSYGFTTEDLYTLIGDDIAIGRLRELLAGSFVPTSLEVDDAFEKQYAKVSAYRVDFPAETFAANIEVTDEEIAAYYEENKASLRSEPKRSIEFVHFTPPDFTSPATLTPPPSLVPSPESTPDAIPEPAPEATPESTPEANPETSPEPTEPTEVEPEATPATEPETDSASPVEESSSSCQGVETDAIETDAVETESDAEEAVPDPLAPDAGPAEISLTPEEGLTLDSTTPGLNLDALDQSASLLDDPSLVPPPIPSGPSLEERTAAMLAYNTFMDDFITAASAPDSDFAALAQAAATAAASSGAKHRAEFGSTDLFAESAPPENLSDEGGLIRAIFTHPASKPISIPVRVANGFYIFRLTGDEAPRDLTLEEASEKIRETLTKEKQAEAVRLAAEEAREKILAGLKEGATFADAAQAAGHEATRIPTFTGNEAPADVADFQTHLREPIGKTAAGQISEPHVVEQSAVLVYVASRVVPEDPENESRRKSVAESSQIRYSSLIFKAWLEQVRAGAEPKPDDLGLGRSVF